jgi:RND family efflux transporter MFP subunit
MKLHSLQVYGLLLFTLAGCNLSSADPKPPDGTKNEPAPANYASFEVIGRTQAVPSRKAVIAPVPLHPVVEVGVAVGDRVKKGQMLVKLDDDEPKADLAVKQAALEAAQTALKESRRYLESIEKAHQKGVISEQHMHETRTAAEKAEADARGAQAAVESLKAELEHYTVEAPIDGVVTRLDVHLGTVSRPGTTVWGEILDLSEIDARCEVTFEQADLIKVGQAADMRARDKKEPFRSAKVVMVGLVADKTTGLVPVVVRLDNGNGALRCEEPVRIRFGSVAEADKK